MTDVGRELLDGVAEGGTRHRFVAWSQIGDKGELVVFAHLAQEPAYGPVDQVVGVMQKDVGNGQTVIVLVMTDKGHAADDGYALFPEAFAMGGEVVEESAVFVEKPIAENLVA